MSPAATKGIVTLRGPLFEKKINKTIERQIITQAMAKFEKRVRRPSKKAQKRIGFKRNPINRGDLHLGRGVAMELHSPTNWPRTTGYAWTNANIAAIKRMAPNVLRKLAREIVAELGGS